MYMLQVREDLLREELSGLIPEDLYAKAVKRANLKASIEGIVVSAIRQILGQGVDAFEVRVEPIRAVRLVNDKEEEIVDAFQWRVQAQHYELGEIVISGKIDAVQTSQVGQAQTSASSVNSGRRSNWSAVLNLAAKYGVEVREYERQKVSWYVGTILSRIAKTHPAAQNDPEWQQLAQAWLQEKPQNAPGIKV
jgi:hypothetical protein